MHIANCSHVMLVPNAKGIMNNPHGQKPEIQEIAGAFCTISVPSRGAIKTITYAIFLRLYGVDCFHFVSQVRRWRQPRKDRDLVR
jgi:hypothetical protein